MANRDGRHTEFGGGPGSPARRKDGSSKELSVSERARIERIKGFRDVPSFSEPRIETVTELTPDGPVLVERPFAPDVNAIAEVDERTNRYGRETRSDEAGS